MEGGDLQTGNFEHIHCLLLVRQSRQPYICRRHQVILFFSLRKPDDKNTARVFVDGLRMSPGNEEYKVPLSPETETQLFQRLDKKLENTATQTFANFRRESRPGSGSARLFDE